MFATLVLIGHIFVHINETLSVYMYFELRKFTQEITAYNNVHLILLD